MAKSEYELYIRTDELFEQLRPVDNLAAHDELLFQVTHQTAELWMKVIMHDVRGGVELIREGQLYRAADLFARAAMIVKLLAEQLAILEKMPPAQYVDIRRTLGAGAVRSPRDSTSS